MSIRSMIEAIRSPSSKYALGTVVGGGLLLGVVGVPTFDYVIHATSSDAFCNTCHAADVALEVIGTVHHDNPLGFHVTCADCHIPKEYVPKLIKKTTSGVKDVYHTMLGTISTPEKFEAHRMHMATVTWAEMNANDSQACRNCHDQTRWDLAAQSDKARQFHAGALAKGKTCIDCHKGIAHKLPEGIGEDHQVEGLDF